MIKSDVRELERIRFELKALTERRKKLKKLESEVEFRIAQYLESKGQPGVKDNGTAVILEEKEKRAIKKKKEKEESALFVLERAGISDPKSLLAELREAQKGEASLVKKLKLKKYKQH